MTACPASFGFQPSAAPLRRLLMLFLGVAVSTAGASVSPTSLAATAEAETGVDTALRPGDDFFAFANGAWLVG